MSLARVLALTAPLPCLCFVATVTLGQIAIPDCPGPGCPSRSFPGEMKKDEGKKEEKSEKKHKKEEKKEKKEEKK